MFVPKETRDYCLKELVETEAKYVDVLTMLRKHFIRAHMAFKEGDKAAIFMNIPNLLDFHTKLLADVVDYVSRMIQSNPNNNKRQQQPILLGAIFREYKREFLMYSTYCCQLPKGENRMKNWWCYVGIV